MQGKIFGAPKAGKYTAYMRKNQGTMADNNERPDNKGECYRADSCYETYALGVGSYGAEDIGDGLSDVKYGRVDTGQSVWDRDYGPRRQGL